MSVSLMKPNFSSSFSSSSSAASAGPVVSDVAVMIATAETANARVTDLMPLLMFNRSLKDIQTYPSFCVVR